MENVTQSTFAQEVVASRIPVVVDFWASWCNPCKMLNPMLEAFEKEYKDKIKIVKVNVEEQTLLASSLGVQSLPTLLFFNKGKEADRIVGLVAQSKIKVAIEKIIKW